MGTTSEVELIGTPLDVGRTTTERYARHGNTAKVRRMWLSHPTGNGQLLPVRSDIIGYSVEWSDAEKQKEKKRDDKER